MEVLQRMAKMNGTKLPPGTLRVETEVGSGRNVRVQDAARKSISSLFFKQAVIKIY